MRCRARQYCFPAGFPVRRERKASIGQRIENLHVVGEVSLPGGQVDEGDSNDSETALREAKEEIGLYPSLVKVVRVLDPYMPKRLVSVTPVIGIPFDKQAFKPLPNSDEVETIFDVPLDMFLKNEKQRSEEREWMGDKYLQMTL